FHGRFTPFRHVGVFPEQDLHWRWMVDRVRAAGRQLKILNLFGYTGIATLAAAEAGAQVTHVDASKKSVGFARENHALAGLEDRPGRGVVGAGVNSAAGEKRRATPHRAAGLAPPKFGRGPNGETWRLFEDLPKHLADCVAILAEDAEFLILTAYAIRAS